MNSSLDRHIKFKNVSKIIYSSGVKDLPKSLKKAYRRGYYDKIHGKWRTDCPYDENRQYDLKTAWCLGFCQAVYYRMARREI